MDAQQTEQLFRQLADLANTATQATSASTNALTAFQKSQEEYRKPRAPDATKVLRQPDVFHEGDPIKYVAWREQFLNWVNFLERRYINLFQEIDALGDSPAKMEDFTDETKELTQQLFSILSSYLKGPASQLVRAEQKDRNGFRVWQELQRLYLPRTRPRTMALGQAIIQHPSFSNQKTMTESLLQFDQLLEQYEYASGHPMPDDLVVSTIWRCVDQTTRRHLQLTLGETSTYFDVKEKLIFMTEIREPGLQMAS